MSDITNAVTLAAGSVKTAYANLRPTIAANTGFFWSGVIFGEGVGSNLDRLDNIAKASGLLGKFQGRLAEFD